MTEREEIENLKDQIANLEKRISEKHNTPKPPHEKNRYYELTFAIGRMCIKHGQTVFTFGRADRALIREFSRRCDSWDDYLTGGVKEPEPLDVACYAGKTKQCAMLTDGNIVIHVMNEPDSIEAAAEWLYKAAAWKRCGGTK